IRSLVQVTVKVLRLDRVMRPIDHPLEQGPEVFQPVCVDAIPNVAFGVIDDLMDVIRLQPLVGQRRVGIDRGARSEARAYSLLERHLAGAWDNLRAMLAVAL